MIGFDEQDDIRTSLMRLKYQLLGIKFELKLRRLQASTKAGFNPDQPRDDIGRWTDAGGATPADSNDEQHTDAGQVFPIFADLDSMPFAQRLKLLAGNGSDGDSSAPQAVGAKITYSNAVTGDERIDKTTDTLSSTLKNVMNVFDFIPYSTPRLYGTAVHSAFGAAVRAQGLEGVKVEFSYMNEKEARYGEEGSVRADVALHSVAGEVIAIYDLKTGGAVVRQSRADELRRHFGGTRYIPVIELHIVRGSRVKHEPLQTYFWLRPETASWINAMR